MKYKVNFVVISNDCSSEMSQTRILNNGINFFSVPYSLHLKGRLCSMGNWLQIIITKLFKLPGGKNAPKRQSKNKAKEKEIDIVRHWFIFKGKKMYDSAMAKH